MFMYKLRMAHSVSFVVLEADLLPARVRLDAVTAALAFALTVVLRAGHPRILAVLDLLRRLLDLLRRLVGGFAVAGSTAI